MKVRPSTNWGQLVTALHQGIGEDERERGRPHGDGEAVEAQQNGEPGEKLEEEKNERGPQADGAARQRAGGGARDLGIELAVRDIVPGAARPAHDDGAQAEQREEAHVHQVTAAMARLHHPGSSSSQVPMARSRRMREA